MVDPVMFSSASGEWETPQELFDKLDKEFNFHYDAAATHENTKCALYSTYEGTFLRDRKPVLCSDADGLTRRWDGNNVFVNPPYGRDIYAWVKKCATEQALVVALLPARTDTKWWHEFVEGRAEVRFIKGRLKFGGAKNSAPFPSVIVIWRNMYERTP